ncbi:hypothetical protein HDV02_000195, partial [Globomyces sp. JEL0801]
MSSAMMLARKKKKKTVPPPASTKEKCLLPMTARERQQYLQKHMNEDPNSEKADNFVWKVKPDGSYYVHFKSADTYTLFEGSRGKGAIGTISLPRWRSISTTSVQ